jgi:hypothetical protein
MLMSVKKKKRFKIVNLVFNTIGYITFSKPLFLFDLWFSEMQNGLTLRPEDYSKK